LRNGLFREDSEPGRSRKFRTAGLAVSVVLHALLVYGLYYARMTLKILVIGPDIKTVILAPPVRITVPSPLDKYLQEPASEEPPWLESRLPKGNAGRGKPRESARPVRPGSGRNESGLAPENLLKAVPGGETENESGLAGELALGKRYQNPEGVRYVINLSALPDHVEDAPLGFEGGPNAPYRPLEKYVQRGRAAGVVSGASSGSGGNGGQRARVVIRSPGYDISPWAKKAIDIIQINWRIPDAVRILDKSEVRISVTIEKNGTLSALTMLSATNLEVLNSAAAAALNSGQPLPPLPDDFPRANLEALFVFEYHE
jgi:hypothetical protein